MLNITPILIMQNLSIDCLLQLYKTDTSGFIKHYIKEHEDILFLRIRLTHKDLFYDIAHELNYKIPYDILVTDFLYSYQHPSYIYLLKTDIINLLHFDFQLSVYFFDTTSLQLHIPEKKDLNVNLVDIGLDCIGDSTYNFDDEDFDILDLEFNIKIYIISNRELFKQYICKNTK